MDAQWRGSSVASTAPEGNPRAPSLREGKREPDGMRTLAGWTAGVLSAGGAIVTGVWFVWPEEMESLFQKYGNGASVLGLLFGLSALAFTIWTVLQTQQIEQEARARERVLEEQARQRERQ